MPKIRTRSKAVPTTRQVAGLDLSEDRSAQAVADALAGPLSDAYARKVSIVVDAAGNGDFTTIADALLYVTNFVTGGADVLVKRGLYTVSTSVVVPPKTTLRGEGEGTLIKLANGANVNVISTVSSDVVIQDLSIDGNKANQTGNSSGVVCFTGCSRVKVRNVKVKDVNGYGIVCYPGAAALEWSDCMVTGARDESFEVGGGSNVAMVNCLSLDSGKNGFYVWLNGGSAATEVTLTNCIAKNFGTEASSWAGFRIEGSAVEGVTLNGCIASGGDGDGFRVTSGAKAVTLTGCVSRGQSNGHGFNIDTPGVTVTGCVGRGNARSGLLIFNTTDFVVTGCTFSNNGQDQAQTNYYNGITIFNSGSTVDKGTVAHNRCFDDQATKTQQYGIRTLNTIGASVQIGPNILDGNGTAGQAFSFGGATAPSSMPWKLLSNVTVVQAGNNVPHGLPYVPSTVMVFMRGTGIVRRAGNPDATNIVLASDVASTTCDILVG